MRRPERCPHLFRCRRPVRPDEAQDGLLELGERWSDRVTYCHVTICNTSGRRNATSGASRVAVDGVARPDNRHGGGGAHRENKPQRHKDTENLCVSVSPWLILPSVSSARAL